MVNGTRTDLPATPNVGASRLSSSTSGSRVGLPDRHGEDRARPSSGAWRRPGPAAAPRSSRRRRRGRRPGGWGSSRAPRRAGRTGRSRARPRRRERLDHDVHPLAAAPPRTPGRSAARSPRGGSSGWAEVCSPRDDVAGLHARRGVPEHGDRRLLLGPVLLDPLGLVEQRPPRATTSASRSSSRRPDRPAGSRSAARRRSRSRPSPATTTTETAERPGGPEERERPRRRSWRGPRAGRAGLGQAEAGLDDHAPPSCDQEQPPDLLDQRAERSPPGRRPGRSRAPGTARPRRSSARTGGRVLGGRAVDGEQAVARGVDARGGARSRSRPPRRPRPAASTAAGRRPAGSPAASCRVLLQDRRPGGQRPLDQDVEDDAAGRQRRVAGGRAWSRRSRRRPALVVDPGQERARRPCRVASGVNSPVEPARPPDLELADRQRRAALGAAPAGPGRPASSRPGRPAVASTQAVQRTPRNSPPPGDRGREEDHPAAPVDERPDELRGVSPSGSGACQSRSETVVPLDRRAAGRRATTSAEHWSGGVGRDRRRPVASGRAACGSSATTTARRGAGWSKAK